MDTSYIAVFWIILCIVNSAIGNTRKIGGFEAFVISLFLSPFVGWLFIFNSTKKDEIEFRLRLLKALTPDIQQTVNAEEVQDIPVEVQPRRINWNLIVFVFVALAVLTLIIVLYKTGQN